ncbi:hypothetical protein F4809DRAFT_596045 [Biscogniauxia mediterranea]|nr:hypothetical protein F4809DRAFT_596045 [Biscogniauxia mediterranea]
MSKRGIKRRAELDVVSDESDSLFVKDTNRKAGKTPRGKKKRLARLEEYDVDEGRAGSRQFQKWAELFENSTKGEANKSKMFMKNFQSKVKKNVDQVQDYIKQQEHRLEEDRDKYVTIFHNLFSTTVDACAPPGLRKGSAATGKKEGHVLYETAQDILSKSASLLKQFTETDEKVQQHKVDFPTARWKQDKQDIKELLELGRQHGEQLVEDLLVPNMHSSLKHDQTQLSDNEKLASDLFKDSHKALKGDTWGTVAADQVRQFKTLAKMVPPKDQKQWRF